MTEIYNMQQQQSKNIKKNYLNYKNFLLWRIIIFEFETKSVVQTTLVYVWRVGIEIAYISIYLYACRYNTEFFQPLGTVPDW